jgi:hypothetical protein
MRNTRAMLIAALVVVLGLAGFWWFSRPGKDPYQRACRIPGDRLLLERRPDRRPVDIPVVGFGGGAHRHPHR